MMKNYDESVEISHNSNWPYIPDHPYRISMNHMRHPCSSVDTAFSHRKPANFAISRNTDIDCILVHNF